MGNTNSTQEEIINSRYKLQAASIDSWRIYDENNPIPGYFGFDWLSSRHPDLYHQFALSVGRPSYEQDKLDGIMETPYARIMSRIINPADLLIGDLRAKAVECLGLESGGHVIDAGCGTGSSFSFLAKAVGPSGHVVGIEIDPFLADRAESRIQKNGWHNVQMLRADAQAVTLRQEFDGLLMFAAHEVLTSPKALDNLLACLKEHARVVAFGTKQTNSLPGYTVNPLLRLASKRWLPFSAPIDTRPWSLLEARLDKITVEERLFGILYIVSGTWMKPVKDRL